MPTVLGDLSGRVAEGREGAHQILVLGGIDHREDPRDLPASPLSDPCDEALTRRAQIQGHPSPINNVTAPGDQTLAHKAVAHSRRRRRVDAQGLGEIHNSLRSPRPKNDQGSVLRQRDFGLVFGQ